MSCQMTYGGRQSQQGVEMLINAFEGGLQMTGPPFDAKMCCSHGFNEDVRAEGFYRYDSIHKTLC